MGTLPLTILNEHLILATLTIYSVSTKLATEPSLLIPVYAYLVPGDLVDLLAINATWTLLPS